VKARDLSEASFRLTTALQAGESEPWSQEHAVRVINRLEAIRSTEPEQVASQAKNIFDQEGWTAQGNVYQARGNMYVTILQGETPTESTKPPRGKSFFETWIKVAGLLVALCALAVAVIVNSDRLKETFLDSASTTPLRGVVSDIQRKPIADATVEIEELRGKPQTTTSDGGFYFPKVPGKAGDRARVFVKKPNYREQNEYVTLPGPVRITLERAAK
jgi:hypothetical protein